MTDRQIISLLKRYMDGATTVEEETVLAEFFCTATDADRPDAISAADWSAYCEMFCMFAPERAEKDQQNEAAAPAVQRFTLRKVALWVASAAAVAVLVFAVSALLPDNTPSGQSSNVPLAQQAARLVPADSVTDSISAEQPQRILADSVKQQPEKRRLHKSVRPYWQPRPPKVYVAEADKSASTRADSTDIEEAVRQADILLQFGNLRAAFLDAIKDADAKTLQTGIVVKIARLCREHSKLLTDNEKQTCISIIDEMKSTLKKVNPDTFMDGVLQEARIAVAK